MIKTVKEAARETGISPATIYIMLRKKKIKSVHTPALVDCAEVIKVFSMTGNGKNITRFEKPAAALTKFERGSIAKIRDIIKMRNKGEKFRVIGEKYGMSRQAARAQYKVYKDDKNYK